MSICDTFPDCVMVNQEFYIYCSLCDESIFFDNIHELNGIKGCYTCKNMNIDYMRYCYHCNKKTKLNIKDCIKCNKKSLIIKNTNICNICNNEINNINKLSTQLKMVNL